MRRFVKLTVTGLLACLLHGSLAAADEKDKGGKPKTAATPAVILPPKIEVPIPIGHDAQLVTLPYYGSDGKLQMNFTIGIAKRFDENRLQMSNVVIETFEDNGDKDLTIEMSASVLNLENRRVTSKTPVKIRNAQFEVTGRAMLFNTLTHEGKLTGHVRMLIFNRDTMTSQEPAQ